jgi:hypothetical protein
MALSFGRPLSCTPLSTPRLLEVWPDSAEGAIALALHVADLEQRMGDGVWPADSKDHFCCRMLTHVASALIRLRPVVVLAVVLLPAIALAEPRPLPVPSTGSCSNGYAYSPTSRTCTPGPNTRERAIPRVGAGCPAGYSSSPTSGMCVENGARR